jgi:hypothetical protein
MIETSFDSRVKIQQIVSNHLPEFLREESPKAAEFLKQYYISQEFQSGVVDIADNLDQYLKLDNLTPEVISDNNILSSDIDSTDDVIIVSSTKGYPSQYGLLKIDDEIITYTGLTTNTFTGCIRGFSGITKYSNKVNITTVNQDNYLNDLVFSKTSSANHKKGTKVTNLSTLFLKEFYKKIKYTLTPGLEDTDLISDLNINNFIKSSKSFYQSKGTEESFRILFLILYGIEPTVVDLEQYLIKPSFAKFIKRKVIVTELVSDGDPIKLIGQTLKNNYDESAQASISDVEILTRRGKTYYKLYLFIGYNEDELIDGEFRISGKTRVLDTVSINSSVITVDSTIGFPSSGQLKYDVITISYTNKSVNQFFGCSGITKEIPIKSDIRSDEIVYSYEDGDINKKVELRITGSLSKIENINNIILSYKNDKISVKNVGEKILNPDGPKTFKEIIANSFIYNTSTRHNVSEISGSTFKLGSSIEKSSLKVGDYVDILLRGSNNNIQSSNAIINDINFQSNEIILGNLQNFSYNPILKYDIRRKLKYADSLNTPLEFGNNKVTSDISNFYTDDNFAYATSNSLPSYKITKKIISSSIPQGYNTQTDFYLQGQINNLSSQDYKKYTIISFENNVEFMDGDEVIYNAENKEIEGLISGDNYYVEVLNEPNKIRLYLSRSFVGTDNYVTFDSINAQGSHTFVLAKDRYNTISPQRILRKFNISQNISDGSNEETDPGNIGLLINGVEIRNYKSNDKIFYGPLERIDIFNSGSGYDVVRPPKIQINNSSIGSTSSATVTVSGNVKSVIVDPQEFDIDSVISVTISGGNGKGCVLSPEIEKRYREIEFDSRFLENGGGVDANIDETITFTKPHNFNNGEYIFYNANGNDEIGVSTYNGSNVTTGKLNNGSAYYAQVVNTRTVRLYPTLDAYTSGINTIGFSTSPNSGIHKFRTQNKPTLSKITVLNPGEGYTNHQIYVKSTGISTHFNTITFDPHHFNDGDLVNYGNTGDEIVGLTTFNSYYVVKVDDAIFKLCDAGIGGTYKENYDRKKYVSLGSTGSGYHIFKYPEIKVDISVSYGSSYTSDKTITATPIVTGNIKYVNLYDSGIGYGSSILNFERKPKISLKTGEYAQVRPYIKDGKITKVNVLSSGSDYYSTPKLVVEGEGTGCILRPVISNNRLVNVIVINEGIGYNQNTTTVRVVPSGSGAVFDPKIRALTINNFARFGEEYLAETQNNLQYSIVGYTPNIANEFNDTSNLHSPIIGWAYDGNPIYGPYGYSDPSNFNSGIKRLTSGYILNTSNILNRPSGFAPGFFVEDYQFSNGDLDASNGRYCKTPEFPNGIYAYFASISDELTSLSVIPQYPYFIGPNYRSRKIEDNWNLDQNFDFNNSLLSRNTLPYKVNEKDSDYEFLVESNEIVKQLTNVDSTVSSSIDSFKIIKSGQDYKIGDICIFENSSDEGGGLSAVVSKIEGKNISRIDITSEKYQNVVFKWYENYIVGKYYPYFNLLNGDTVTISGLSTYISKVNGQHICSLQFDDIILLSNMATNVVQGKIEDIYVSKIPSSVSVGSSLVISDSETVSVLNIFNQGSILRIRRSDVGYAHTESDIINILPSEFTIPVKTNYFDSKINEKIYFNPKQSVGIGSTPGIGINLSQTIGGVSKDISVPTQAIYIPNHPFKTGDFAILRKNPGRSPLIVSNSPNSAGFTLLSGSTLSEKIYIINKSKDLIGITTSVSNSFNTKGLFLLGPIPIQSDYSIESDFAEIKGEVQKNKAVISTIENHDLSTNDRINLTLNSNISVGIGTSSTVQLLYNSSNKNLLINPNTFNQANVDLENNQINLISHSFKTGDKVFYNYRGTPISGLSTGGYFVYKVDDNSIQLTETYADIAKEYPNVVKFGSKGGAYQRLSLINPELVVEKNNTLVFDVSDPSLFGYSLNIFYDSKFTKKFLSTGISTEFNFIGIGTIGLSNARSTLKYTNDLPPKLYYNLVKDGLPLENDDDITNASSITFINNICSGSYSVSGIGSTTFNINLKESTQKKSYTIDECDTLEYTTTSLSSKGGISDLNILSNGYGYKKLPIFKGTSSDLGKNANIIPYSKNIGNIKEYNILNQGFDYSSDKTLRPEALIPSIVYTSGSNQLQSIEIVDGGNNYSSAPKPLLKNPITNKIVDDKSLTCKIQSGTVSEIKIDSPIRGLDSVNHEVVFVNNSNGIGINSIQSSISGVVTCTLITPIISGFITPPFSIGDEIFVENIEKDSETGKGFNSTDYDYQFFKVTAFENTNPAVLEYNLSGLTTNPGIAKTSQLGYGMIIKKDIYPSTIVNIVPSKFSIGENVLCDFGNGYKNTDLIVEDSNASYIKLKGLDFVKLKLGNSIKGIESAAIATIVDIDYNSGKFTVDKSDTLSSGWIDRVGLLNEMDQVIQDNDYYQNLSYTIKSPIEFSELIDPVNRLVHAAGLKNFADTQIQSTANIVSYGSTSSEVIVLDVIEESRVDSINNYSLSIDVDTVNNKSRYLKFKNKTLTDYIDCATNRVLKVDDFSQKFSKKDNDRDLFTNLFTFLEDTIYSRYLIQVSDITNNNYQLSEVAVIFYDKNIYTFEKTVLSTSETKLGEIKGEIDDYNTKTLRFTPEDPYDTDYDIKYLQTYFNNLEPRATGIATNSIGSINLTGISTSVGIGSTTTIISLPIQRNSALVANVFVFDTVRFDFNYVEVVVDHDNINTYIAEYYFDNKVGISSNYIGTFSSVIESGFLKLNVSNNINTRILVNSSIVGFGSTSAGIGTYRFKYPNQPDGSERSAKFESNYVVSSGVSTVFKFKTNEIMGSKSLIRVSNGNSSSVHQLLCLQDMTNVYTVQYPYISTKSVTGIGTFGAEYSGDHTVISFYPDAGITGNLTIQSYNQLLYSYNDFENEALSPVNNLQYGNTIESVKLAAYDGLNGPRANKVEFDLNYLGNPIFRKIFNPSNSFTLNQSTGVITIPNHFFSTGEKLIYTPNSTFIGVGETSIGIGLTANYLGIVTNRLPSEVYAIKLTNDTFQLSTRREYALSGIYVTFTSTGEGNAHELEMDKKIEKSIITIDGIAQKPLSYTPIVYKLSDNGGQIGFTTTYFALTGIATIYPNDLLKVGNEYMQVISTGLGVTSKGPITGIGTYNVVYVKRGYVGTSATSHKDLTDARIYRGSFNINSNKIYFTEPPRGSARERRDGSNLPYPTSSFSGRVFLRNDYTNNLLYDDISDKFDGISSNYRLTVQGINTSGIETGSGVLFINGVFQTPSTENNIGNNYSYEGAVGITSVVFTGITSTNRDIINSISDVNQNQLPRGGLIVSLGSTQGLGYAPLVGAAVTAVLNISTGAVIAVGVGTRDIIGSGYRNPVSVAITDSSHSGSQAIITASVGAGGTLAFNIVNGGSGYVNPTILVSQPTYENLPVTGVFRRGIGNTSLTGSNLLISLDVGASSTTGIGSTYFEVKEFKISRPGYGFQVGDIIKPVGLVTDRRLNAPIREFQLTVLDTFSDSFSSWQFGELDYIDSVRNLQDGVRRRFPLYYNGQLLSFQKGISDPTSVDIDLNSVLVIFINGVLQEPGYAYQFEGGTSFTFTEAPKSSANVSIFFYRGTRGVDSFEVNVNETIKIGDEVQVRGIESLSGSTDQDPRTIQDIIGSDIVQTNIYTGPGIDSVNYRFFDWSKQKVDTIINGDYVYKVRDSLEPQVYPTARIIKNINANSSSIFVDNIELFNYEENDFGVVINQYDALIVNGSDPVSAAITAIVSNNGTISQLSIVNGGSGYNQSSPLQIKISAPKYISVGVGTTATATVNINNGSITGYTITNPGLGYSKYAPPQVIVPLPEVLYENVTLKRPNQITQIARGFSGIITGITTSVGTNGNPLALKFFLRRENNAFTFDDLNINYPIYIFNTNVGTGLTSIDSSNTSTVGISTTYVDNIYYVHSILKNGPDAVVVSNIRSNSNVIGLNTTGSLNRPVGNFSWGILSNLESGLTNISIGVTGLTVDAGLSTFPVIQRRNYGLGDSGALRKSFT